MTPEDYQQWIALLYDDAYAACFQTMAQYRMALITRARSEAATAELRRDEIRDRLLIMAQDMRGRAIAAERDAADLRALVAELSGAPLQPITPEPEGTSQSHSRQTTGAGHPPAASQLTP